jgi:broad specificity phosphatase PhoE
MPLPIDMIFVRHGESVGNVASREFKSTGDPTSYDEEFLSHASCRWELTERGHEQARLTGQWIVENFGEDTIGRYYSSPYDRTAQTALGLHLPQGKEEKILYLDDRLRERSHGDTEAISPADMGTHFEINLRAQQQSPYYARHPNGESYADLVEGRVRSIFDTLIRECSTKAVVLVTHGDYMNAVQMGIERINSIEWQKERKNPYRRMWNCQVLHYSRRNPYTGEIGQRVNFRRTVRAWQESDGGTEIVEARIGGDDWHTNNRARYSNQDLEALLEARKEY